MLRAAPAAPDSTARVDRAVAGWGDGGARRLDDHLRHDRRRGAARDRRARIGPVGRRAHVAPRPRFRRRQGGLRRPRRRARPRLPGRGVRPSRTRRERRARRAVGVFLGPARRRRDRGRGCARSRALPAPRSLDGWDGGAPRRARPPRTGRRDGVHGHLGRSGPQHRARSRARRRRGRVAGRHADPAQVARRDQPTRLTRVPSASSRHVQGSRSTRSASGLRCRRSCGRRSRSSCSRSPISSPTWRRSRSPRS